MNKPPGLPTQPTLDEARDNLFAAVKKFLSSRDKVVDPYVALHHRLDRDTSGVLLLVKHKDANAGIGEAFSKHLAQKTYQALSSGKPTEEVWTVKNYLARAQAGKSSHHQSVKSGGDFAETRFRVLEQLKGFIWIEAQPKTGRTHQIRVHLSEAGFPILGDRTYGGDLKPAPRLMLHAARLTFEHPITQNQISIESPLPQDFTQCLEKLRNI